MSGFNGFSKIELEMIVETAGKALPGLLSMAPQWVKLTRKHYDELKKQGFSDREAMYMAVQSTGKQFGFN